MAKGELVLKFNLDPLGASTLVAVLYLIVFMVVRFALYSTASWAEAIVGAIAFWVSHYILQYSLSKPVKGRKR